MSIRSTILAAPIFLAVTGTAQTNAMEAMEARSIDLGELSGSAYYTVEHDGFHVVTTLAEGIGTPVRVVAVLAPGESVVLSTPREVGATSNEVEISREGDRLVVRTAELAN